MDVVVVMHFRQSQERKQSVYIFPVKTFYFEFYCLHVISSGVEVFFSPGSSGLTISLTIAYSLSVELVMSA